MSQATEVVVRFTASVRQAAEALARAGEKITQSLIEIGHQVERVEAAERLRLYRAFAALDPTLRVYTQTVDGQCRVVLKRLGGWS